MSDPTNVFDDEKGQATPVEKTTDENPFADQLGAIVNDGGEQKYATVEKALEALKVSQNEYIPTLKTSLEASQEKIKHLEEQLAEREALSEVVEKLTSGKPSDDGTPTKSGVTEETVLNLIKSYEQTSKTEAVLAQNGERVANTLTEKFGEKTRDVVAAKAKELNITPSKLGEMAKESPNVVLQLFNEGPVKAGPTSSSIQMPLSAPDTNEPLTPPEKSLLVGATAKEQKEFMKKIKDDVYKRLGVET